MVASNVPPTKTKNNISSWSKTIWADNKTEETTITRPAGIEYESQVKPIYQMYDIDKEKMTAYIFENTTTHIIEYVSIYIEEYHLPQI